MKENNKTLNQILDDYHNIEVKIIENEGEVDASIEDMLNINKAELEGKLDGYEGFIKYLDGQISYLKNMEAHYLKRRKILEKTVTNCKQSMIRALSLTESTKVKTPNYNFSLCESESWSANLDNIDKSQRMQLIEEGFAENVFKLSMSSLKSHYKSSPDEDVPKWVEIAKKPYIRVS